MDRSAVTSQSLRDWLSRGEWRNLLIHLQSVRGEVIAALAAADANNVASVARLQAEVRALDYFLDGDAAEALLSALREKEKQTTNE